MQRVMQYVVAAVLAVSGADLSAQPQERAMGGIVGITVYDDRDFRGRNANFRDDVADLRSAGMNDRIVSFEIARGETWEVCEHAFYAGRCQVFTGYESDLRQRGWSRMISSMRRVRGGGGGGGWGGGSGGGGWGGGGGNERGLVLYSGRNFGGQSRVITGFANDLRQIDFSDQAESVRVPRGERWELCDNIEFDRCRVVDADISDLNRIGLRRKISSVRPLRGGGGGGGWGGSGGSGGSGGGWGGSGNSRGRIILFTEQNYRGRSYVVDQVTSSVGMSTAQSVRVEGGNWQLCEDTNFRGRCTTVNVDIPNLRSMGLPGRVRSARPAR